MLLLIHIVCVVNMFHFAVNSVNLTICLELVTALTTVTYVTWN
jgi:hypothetical protein